MNEFISVALSSLAALIGGLTLFVVSGLRSDISEIRAQVRQNSEDIARLKGRFDRTRNEKISY